MIAPWSVRFFGGLRAERKDGGAAPFTRLRTQTVTALFAFLCCAHPGREHGREELAARFWPDADPEDARNQLRVALSALRRALEPPPAPAGSVVEASRTHVRLRPGSVQTDVAAFEAAVKSKDWARARELCDAGPFLPGVYDEWVLAERERLEALIEEVEEHAPSVLPTPPAAKPLHDATERSLVAAGHRPAPLPGRRKLPLIIDRFFGRAEETNRLTALLGDPAVRVVTLTGPGGVGKTRLSVEAARGLADGGEFPGGVWFVPVAGVPDAAALPAALPALVRDALGIAPQPGVDPLAQVAEEVGDARALFVLDNLEQAADGAAEALPPLLARLPGAALLVTSRVRLGLRGEAVVALAPLPVPDESAGTADAVAESAAAALFTDRARAAEADFALTPRNAADVGALVRCLDGVPLALELAAAWANVLTPRQMREQIASGSPELLAARRAERREERHRSLRAAVEWSLGLLPPELSALFARLSVFRGGFTAEAAEAVCEAASVRAALARLNQHSLVTSRPTDDGASVRFDLLEVLREAGAERLSKGEQETLARRHAGWVLDTLWAAPAEARPAAVTNVVGPDNVRAALRHLLGERDGAAGALRLCVAAWPYWFGRGLWHEARESLLAALGREGEPGVPNTLRAEAWKALGGLYLYGTEFPKARECFEKQVALAEADGDPTQAAAARMNLAGVLWGAGEADAALDLYAGALAALRPVGGEKPVLLANCLNNFATLLHVRGDYDRAEPLFAEGLALFRTLGDAGRIGVGACLNGLGACAEVRGDYAAARDRFAESVAIYREAGDAMRLADALLHLAGAHLHARDPDPVTAAAFAESLEARAKLPNPDGFVRTYEDLAAFLARRGRSAAAARLLAAAAAQREAHGIYVSDKQEQEYADLEKALRAALGDAGYDAARAEGGAWTHEQAVAAARAEIEAAKNPAVG